MIYRYLDAKKNHSLDVERVYNLSPFFYLILGFPTAVFELLSRGQPFQSTPKFLVGFKPGSFRFSVQHRKPPGLFSESLCRKQFTLTIYLVSHVNSSRCTHVNITNLLFFICNK